jgi:hypothetical protein
MALKVGDYLGIHTPLADADLYTWRSEKNDPRIME